MSHERERMAESSQHRESEALRSSPPSSGEDRHMGEQISQRSELIVEQNSWNKEIAADLPFRRGNAQIGDAKVKIVPLEDLYFTHDSIANRFRDGKTLQRLIDELCSGHVDPMNAKFLILEAYNVQGKLMTMNNRRLYCLQQFQKRTDRKVFIRVRVTEIVQFEALKLFQAWTSKGHEQEIRLRDCGLGHRAPIAANFHVRQEIHSSRKVQQPCTGDASNGKLWSSTDREADRCSAAWQGV